MTPDRGRLVRDPVDHDCAVQTVYLRLLEPLLIASPTMGDRLRSCHREVANDQDRRTAFSSERVVTDRTEIDVRRALAAVRRHDQFAADKLFSSTSAPIYGLARAITGCQDLAMSATQDVMAEAWRGTATRPFPRPGTAVSWLMALGHRTVVDRVRATRAPATNSRRSARRPRRPLPPMRGLSQRARELLAALPRVEREPLLLAYFDSRSTTEIAALLRIDEDTVNVRLRAGLLSLSAVLAE